MLLITDKHGLELFSKKLTNSQKRFKFIVHCKELLSYFVNENSITVFYGFLDMDIENLSPAEFVNSKIKLKQYDSLADLYGSFVIFHYEMNSGRSCVFSDILGDFLVNYYIYEKEIRISDFPQPLLNKTNSSINHKRLLHYFALTQPQNDGSFFSEIKQLSPRKLLEIENDRVQEVNYYQPSVDVDFKHSDINIAANHLLQLMQDVIRLQTKKHQQFGVTLSGGMDSTFVAANGLKTGKKVSTYSYLFPNMPEADEKIWIDSMRNMEFDMNTFVGESYWPLKPEWNISLNSPVSNPYRHLKTVIYQRAQSQNVQLLLSGVFADHLYSGSNYWLIDQIKHSPLKAINSLYQLLKRFGVRKSLKQISPAKWSNKIGIAGSRWMTPDSCSVLKKEFVSYAKIQHSHPQQFALVYGMSTAQSSWLENEYAFKENVFIRHPFRDRRIVDFMMKLPAWLLGETNKRKALLTTAGKGMLPDSILNRKKLTTLSPLFIKGVQEKEFEFVKQVLTDKSSTWNDFIDTKALNKVLKSPDENTKESEYLLLWQCLSYELWKNKLTEV